MARTQDESRKHRKALTGRKAVIGGRRAAGTGTRPSIAHRALSVLMSVVLAVGLMPLPAFAAGGASEATPQLVAQESGFLQESPAQVAPESLEPKDLEPQNATYELDYEFLDESHTAIVKGVKSGAASGDLVIPEVVTNEGVDYTVVAIGAEAFKNQTGFTGSLSLPNTVREIGESAFDGCSKLTGNMVLPSGLVTVGASAFKNCRNIGGTWSLPTTLTSLGSYAFYDCVQMTGTVTIPAGIKSIPDYCFYLSGNRSGEYSGESWWHGGGGSSIPNDHGVTGIVFADDSQIESIGAHAFDYNWYVKGGLYFPTSLKTVGDYAFYNTGVRAASTSGGYVDPVGTEGPLSLPDGLVSIGEYAFAKCNFLGSLTIPSAVGTLGKGAFKSAGFNAALTISGDMAVIPEECFEGCEFAGLLTFPNTLTAIGKRAFADCKYFATTLTIPNGVTDIGDSAFDSFASDSKYADGTLTLPNTLETIGASAFWGADSFTGALSLPDSVKSIGANAFRGCCYFTSLKLPDNESYTTIEEGTFSSSSSYEIMGFEGALSIPDNVTVIGKRAFYYCNKFTGDLNLPSGVTSVGDSAFDHCRWFSGTLTLPRSLESIGAQAFSWCDGFSAIAFEGTQENPSSLTSIGESAFFGCENMSGALSIPAGVQAIEESAFRQFGNKSEQGVSLSMGPNVQSIGDYAFCNSGFTGTATVPGSVTSLGESIFSGCTRLEGYALPDSLTSIPEGLFQGCSSLECALVIPTSATSIGRSAFYGCSKLTGTLEGLAHVSSIGSSAFEQCSSLSGDCPIADGVTRIESSTFEGCSGLTGTLTIPSSVTYLGSEAFKDCSGLTGTLTIPSSVTSLDYSAFENCSGFTALDMQQKATSLSSSLFAGCTKLAGDVAIPAGVTKLGSNIFNGCENLSGKLTIPDSVTSANDYALSTSGFGTIENNSNVEFDGAIIAQGTTDYYVDSTGAKVRTLGKGTYTRVENGTAVDISGAVVSAIPDEVFNYQYHYPEPTVTLNGEVLVKDEHYTLSYSDNRYVGTATVYIKGYEYNGYTGTIEAHFKIKTAPKPSVIVIAPQQKEYTGKKLSYTGDIVMRQGSTGEVTYQYYSDLACQQPVAAANVVDAGIYYVTATVAADDEYAAATSAPVPFIITPATPSIKLAAQTKTYTGKKIAYTGKVTTNSPGKVTYKYYSDAKCTKEVKPANVKNPGVYYVRGTVAETKNYAENTSAAVKLTVKPKGTALTSVAAASKGFTAKWKKQADQTTGYQVQYALNAKYKSAKLATVKGAAKTSVKVAKLKAKTKYWVRVRTYKTVGKTNYFSGWSASKTVTTKK